MLPVMFHQPENFRYLIEAYSTNQIVLIVYHNYMRLSVPLYIFSTSTYENCHIETCEERYGLPFHGVLAVMTFAEWTRITAWPLRSRWSVSGVVDGQTLTLNGRRMTDQADGLLCLASHQRGHMGHCWPTQHSAVSRWIIHRHGKWNGAHQGRAT